MHLVSWIEIRENDCWLALPLERNVTRGALWLILWISSPCCSCYCFSTPSVPLAEMQTHAANYCTVSPMVGVHRGIWGSKMKQASGAECVGWASSSDGHESSSPRWLGFWHHSGLIRGREQFPPQMSFTPDEWGRPVGVGTQQNKLCITSLRRLAACCQDLRCVVILKGGGRCVCAMVGQCVSMWRTVRVIIVAGRRAGSEAGQRHVLTRF